MSAFSRPITYAETITLRKTELKLLPEHPVHMIKIKGDSLVLCSCILHAGILPDPYILFKN